MQIEELVERLRGDGEFGYGEVGHQAADALEAQAAENTRLRDGLSAIVNCQSPLTRAQVREACAEILAGHTTAMTDQSPFAARIATLEAQLTKLKSAAKPFELFAKSLLEWRDPYGLVQSKWPENIPVLDRSHPVEGEGRIMQRCRVFRHDFEKLAALMSALRNTETKDGVE